MRTTTNNYNFHNDNEIEDVLHLVEKNIDCTNKLIKRIDALIEKKHFPDSIFKILTTLRNTCAVNVMNITKLSK